MNMNDGNTTNTNIRYISVLNVPYSTHGYSAVSLPENPRKIKLHVDSQRNVR